MGDIHNGLLLLDSLTTPDTEEPRQPPKTIQEVIKETQEDIRRAFEGNKRLKAEINLTENV